MAILPGYEQFGGAHPVTAALTNVLAAEGVRVPGTDQPFSEAMILGIGGGLGIGYILWEFKKQHSAFIVLGFRNRWNDTLTYLLNACARLGVTADVAETTDAQTARANLQAALAAGHPPVLWTDKAQLPYLHLPPEMSGYANHIVAVCGYDAAADEVLIDDCAAQPFRLPADVLNAARTRIPSDKARSLTFTPPADAIDIAGAVRAGIADCVAHLTGPSESFALPMLGRWARLMTDRRNKQGWPRIFKDRVGLYSTLRTFYEGIELDGTGGGGLRGLYADFLAEAADLAGMPALLPLAGQYRTVGGMWSDLAALALPSDVAPLKETRDLLQARYTALQAQEMAELARINAELDALQAQYDRAFPTGDKRVERLFEEMSRQLDRLAKVEQDVAAALGAALRQSA